MRYSLILGALVAAAPMLVLSAAPVAAAFAREAATQSAAKPMASGPVAPISALYSALSTIGREGASTPFAQRAQLVAPAIDRAFNIPTVLQTAVGLRYRSLSDQQKQQLQSVFREFTVARYVSNFTSDTGDTLKVNPAPRPSPYGSDQIVRTELVAPSGEVTHLDYVMRQFPQGWQATDVLLNGHISQVAVQRSDFASTIESGNISRLIEKLKKKIQNFSES